MRILFISNYNAWERIENKVMPSHPLFGVNEMINHFETPDSAILKSQFGGVRLSSSSLLTRQNLSCYICTLQCSYIRRKNSVRYDIKM